MKLILWFVYMITKTYPVGFLLASAKALGWSVSVESTEDGNVASITISNPVLKGDDDEKV